MSHREALKITRADLTVILLDVFALLCFGGALIFLALSHDPLGFQPLLAHTLLAAGFVGSMAAHNLSGRQSLYWSHFDFLVAVFFAYSAASLHYSEAPGATALALTWMLDGVWAYLLGRYLFFRRLRSFNLVALAVCLGLWAGAEHLLSRPAPANEAAQAAVVSLEAMQSLAFTFGLVILLAQPFFLLQKPANLVFVLWSGAILVGISVWIVQTLLALLESYRLGIFGNWAFTQALLLSTVRRLFLAYPITGGGVGTWPWMAASFRPVGYLELPPVVPAFARIPCEWGAVGTVLFAAAWLRVPVFVLRRWQLFPNRRLRLSVLVYLTLVLLEFARLFVTDDLAQPWGWVFLWAIVGTFVSLVAVRDPMRIFYEKWNLAEQHATATPRVRGKLSAALMRHEPSRLGVAVRTSVAGVTALILLTLQAMPHRAKALAQRREGEALSDVNYGQRVERAVFIFPFYAEGWARLAQHYQERAVGDSRALLALAPRVETAYRHAIKANPYVPTFYEQLALFYSDTNIPSRAQEILRLGVANNPNHFVLRLLLVRELERAQSFALATWHLRQAIFRIAPQQAELFVRLAELYEYRGMRMDAVRSCQYARQGLPDTSNVLMRLRRVAERLGISKVLL
ncbi:MAG: tetratricopeptide repeat protein [Candidatus Sumerlaeaceae bacterium]